MYGLSDDQIIPEDEFVRNRRSATIFSMRFRHRYSKSRALSGRGENRSDAEKCCDPSERKLSPLSALQAVLRFRLQQAQVSVLAQIQDVGAAGFDVYEDKEAVAEQFHLQGGVLH